MLIINIYSWFMGTSDVLKVLKIAQAVGEYNLRTFKTSRVTINDEMHEQVHTIFIYYILNKITQTRYFVRARILPVLGLVFFQSPMFARHSTRSV